jgi:hypothetical protein
MMHPRLLSSLGQASWAPYLIPTGYVGYHDSLTLDSTRENHDFILNGGLTFPLLLERSVYSANDQVSNM